MSTRERTVPHLNALGNAADDLADHARDAIAMRRFDDAADRVALVAQLEGMSRQVDELRGHLGAAMRAAGVQGLPIEDGGRARVVLGTCTVCEYAVYADQASGDDDDGGVFHVSPCPPPSFPLDQAVTLNGETR